MKDPRNIPTALRVVAYIHLVGGLLSVVTFFVLLFNGTFSIRLGILGIPIFFGLLNLRNGWRICAMVLMWFGLIGFPIIFVISLVSSVPAHFQLFGLNIARIHPWFVSLGTIPFFLLVVWQYRVLIRPDVRELFIN